jgi:hypothetical protein
MSSLPEPVVPAISMCGIVERLSITGVPVISSPSTMAKGEGLFSKFLSSIPFFKQTRLRSRFGTSMPTADFPGIGATTLIRVAFKARARSLSRLDILSTH